MLCECSVAIARTLPSVLESVQGPRQAGWAARIGGGTLAETDGGATPLIDATIKFLDEFVYKETPSGMQQPQQKAGKGKLKEDEEEKKERDTMDSLELSYIYDAMKEKRQLNSMLVCTLSHQLLMHADLMYAGWTATGCSTVFRPLPRGTR